MPGLERNRVTRRRFLTVMGALGAAAGLTQMVACSQPAASPTTAPAAPTVGPTPPPQPTRASVIATAAAPTAAPTVAPAATTGTGTSAAGTPKRGGTLKLAVHEDLASIDPFMLNGVGDIMIQGLMSQPLVTGNAKDEIEPVLAESFKTEDNGKTWTFKLRQGVKFHNGKEMTADEVKWSLDRTMDDKLRPVLYSVFKPIELKNTVVDKYTVKCEITGGFGAFLSNLAQSTRASILHPDSVGSDGKLTKPIGTGPFMYVDWKPGAEFKAARHPEYWQKGDDGKSLPYIDALDIKITTDATTRLNALKASEVEFITNPPLSDVRQWVDTKPPAGIGFMKWFYNYSDYLSCNARRAPFDNVKARQAIRWAIDREALNDGMYFGLGEIHNQPFKKISSWYEDVPTDKPDLAKAKQLMQEAGLKSGTEIKLLVWSPLQDKLGEITQAQLAQIGIKANLDKRDVGNFFKELPTYNWDMATLVIGTIFHPDRPYSYLSSKHASHPNVGGYDDPEIDKLLEQGRNELDFAKAKAIYKTIVQKYVLDVGTPHYTTNVPLVDAWRDYVKGFNAYGYDLVSINAEMGLHKTWIAK